MADYKACPNCGCCAKEAISSNYFPVYKCRECKKVYCAQCGGRSCPHCGASQRAETGRVYAG